MAEVYVFMGLLESGKTSMLLDALKSPDFRDDGPTLVISCEEGEVEYSKEFLEASDASLVRLEEESQLTTEQLMAFDAAYQPNQVMIEYNGTWPVDRILDLAHSQKYGTVLRAKGIVPAADGGWLEFDLVPMEYEIRPGQPDYTGKVCVIGTDLPEDALKQAFHI